jgi:beta-lactamase class A
MGSSGVGPTMQRTIEQLIGQVPARVMLLFRDLDEDLEIAYDADRPVVAASTIKLLVLARLYRAFAREQLDPRARVRIASDQVVPGSGILRWLAEPPPMTLRDLAVLMTIVSDNVAANALIDVLGFAAMEELVVELGLTGTALRRPFWGRAAYPGEPENLVTARDLATLLAALELGHIVPEGHWLDDLRMLLRAQQFRDIIPARLPEAVIVGNKTGTLPGSVHDAALLWAPFGRAVLVLLTSEVTDFEATRRALADLAKEIVDHWQQARQRGNSTRGGR